MDNKEFDLKSELKSIGMNQRDFSKISGFSTSTISIWNTTNNMSKVGRSFLDTLIDLQEKDRILERLKNDCLNIKNY